MSNHEEFRPIDRDTVERLLRGDQANRAGHLRLDALLTAAGAPAHSRELAGEDAAVAAFAAAQLESPQNPRRISMLKSTLAKLLTVKVAAACLAVSGAGGVALAAGTGHLPGPLSNPAVQKSAEPSHPPVHRPSGFPSTRPSMWVPPADVLQLCKKWEARPADMRKADLDKPEYAKLVEHAGRRDRGKVDHFCAHLPKVKPSGLPSKPPHFSPGGEPPVRPSGKPTASAPRKPGPRPGNLPSGAPHPTLPSR